MSHALTRTRRLLFLTVLLLAAVPLARAAQSPAGTPWVGEPGITETVAEIMARERASPVPDGSVPRPAGRPLVQPDRRNLPQDPAAPPIATWPPNAPVQAVPQQGAQLLPQAVSTEFNVTTMAEASGFVPPDSVGAVGPTQVLGCTNGRIRVFDKSGVLGGLNASLDGFFTSVRNGAGTGDPQVRYDRTSGRFFVTCINIPASGANRVLVAVSSGATITNASSFTFYFFQQDTVAPAGDTGAFADYPKLGVDANALYIGADMFNPGFTNTTCWVVRKSSVTSGGPIVATAFRSLIGADGPYAPQGVDNDDPAATEGYVVGVSAAVFGRLVVRRISNPGGAPTISANLTVTVPSTAYPQDQPALGSAVPLSAVDDRVFAARITKVRSTGTSTLWTAHNIEVNASGVASGTGNRNGARWYQIGNLAGAPSLIQSGTLFDSAATNPRGYTFPSCCMTGQGHMALGATVAGAADRAGVAAAGRLQGDALGSTQAATISEAGVGSYNVEGGPNAQRWGDYSYTCVDPSDDQTVWTFQEYCNANNSWAVRVTRLLAPPPTTPSACSPASGAPGQTLTVTVTGSVSAGSAFYDTEPGFNRMQAAFSGTGITVNSISAVSPAQFDVNITIAPTATASSRTVAVTNPDGQSSVSAAGIFGVAGAPITAFCAGDGIDPNVVTFCPCFNFGALGHGCANSVDPAGGFLTAAGTPNPDTVVLSASQMPAVSSCIYLQGDALTDVQFGDGVRCVGGSLIRLRTRTNVGGASTFPDSTDTVTLSQRGSVTPGSGATRYYQTYYRNASGTFCPPETFNVTNGQIVVW